MQADGSPSASPERTPGYLNFKAVLLARAAAQQQQLDPSLRYLLEIVAGYTNGTPAWPSYDALAGITGLAPVTVRQRLKALVDQGYLTLGRRKARNGGWGQPEWGLGRVVLGHHLTPQVEVMAGNHSSDAPPSLASDGPPSQKRRESVDHGGVVVQSNDGGKREEVGKRKEKRGAPAQPSKNTQVIDLLRAAGQRPTLRIQDHTAIKASDLTPEQITEVYLAIVQTPFGDDFMRRSLTVQSAIQRWDGYCAQKKAPGRNGRPRALDRYADSPL